MSLLMDQLLADQQRIRQRTERPLPAGCDQQGRHVTRTWPDSDQPMAAEACTDEGISPEAGARLGVVLVLLGWPVVAVIVAAAVAIFWPVSA